MSVAHQAYLSGWYAHGMAGFNHARLREVLAVPDGFAINAVAAIGKLGDRSLLTDSLDDREIPADREPVETLVFKGRM